MTEQCKEKLFVHLQCRIAKYASFVANKVKMLKHTCYQENLTVMYLLIGKLYCYNEQYQDCFSEKDFCDIYNFVDNLLCECNC
jgi:hypothetical protein